MHSGAVFSRKNLKAALWNSSHVVSGYTNPQHNAQQHFPYFILFYTHRNTTAVFCMLLPPPVCLLQVSRPQRISSVATQRGAGNQSVTGGDAQNTQHRTFIASSDHLFCSSPVDSPGGNTYHSTTDIRQCFGVFRQRRCCACVFFLFWRKKIQ